MKPTSNLGAERNRAGGHCDQIGRADFIISAAILIQIQMRPVTRGSTFEQRLSLMS